MVTRICRHCRTCAVCNDTIVCWEADHYGPLDPGGVECHHNHDLLCAQCWDDHRSDCRWCLAEEDD